jgi:predicted nucleic acid-binding Zn ribbon protein
LPNVPEEVPPKDRLRRTRDALLLDLGALVYELHRRGERAPDLLQQKARELSEVDDQVRDTDAPAEPCPSCGTGTEPGQLVCTSCGARLGLSERRPTRTLAALAAVAAVLLLGAAASGFALSEITSDDADGGGDPAATQAPPEPPAAAEGQPQEPTRADGPAGSAPQPEPRRSLLLDWPEDLTAHTVVLVTTSDRAAALRLARQAARSGLAAGLLRGDDHNLGAGLWVVFSGRFDSPEGASRQASDLAERFPGAYPQLVEPAG